MARLPLLLLVLLWVLLSFLTLLMPSKSRDKWEFAAFVFLAVGTGCVSIAGIFNVIGDYTCVMLISACYGPLMLYAVYRRFKTRQ